MSGLPVITPPHIGSVVERMPGRQQMVVSVAAPDSTAGIPWRVQLAGDAAECWWEWDWLWEAGYVVAP